MHISLNTDHLNDIDQQVIHALSRALSAPQIIPAQSQPASGPAGQPQPQVGDNSGTSASGSLPSEGAGVSGEAAQANGAASPAPVIEKAKRGPKPKAKEDAAAQVGEPAPSPAPASAQPSNEISPGSSPSATPAADPALTLDDVRAKLQAFTAVKGIEAGIELLKTFDAGRISELPAARYAEFAGKCAVENV